MEMTCGFLRPVLVLNQRVTLANYKCIYINEFINYAGDVDPGMTGNETRSEG